MLFLTSFSVKARDLMTVSELEQDIVASNDASGHKARLVQLLDHPCLLDSDRLRLVLLYVLK